MRFKIWDGAYYIRSFSIYGGYIETKLAFYHFVNILFAFFISSDLTKPKEEPGRRGKKRRKDGDDDEDEMEDFEKAPRTYG